MGRIALGWQLAKQSWAVVRADRSLLIFPVVGGITSLIAAIIFFGLGAGVVAAVGSPWVALPFILVGVYALIVISQFCAVALAACATHSLDGQDTTFNQGISAARARLGLIFAWAAVMLVVGGAISALQAVVRETAGDLVGSIVGGLANFAWAVATFFVIPVIALEGVGPKDAIKRSTGIIKERWGESVVGAATIGGAVFLIGILPGILLVVGGGVLVSGTGGVAIAAGALLIVVGIVVIVIASVFQAAMSAVFRVALYRYATVGDSVGAFSQDQLAGAFRPKRGRKNSLA